MIITLTPNPSVDRTVVVDGIALGAVNRAESVRVDPGGKGVNVSRALTAHGSATTAILPVGGPDGALLIELLAASGVTVDAVTIAANTRSNISILSPGGTTTKINEPGPALTPGERAEVIARVRANARTASDGARWLVGSGSLPPGLDTGFYAELVQIGAEHGLRTAIDTTGSALVQACAAGASLIKPNEEELAQAVGRRLDTLGDVIAAAESLRAPGAQVIVSLGARGAVLVDDSGAVLAQADTDATRAVVSTVGAGDSLLAGYLHAGTCDAQALATGVAWGTAAVSLPGSKMPGPADVASIHVTISEPSVNTALHH